MARTRQLAGAAVAALALVAAAPAQAQNDLYNDFQSDGQIDACAYNPGQLQNGLDSLPPDLQQYAPGFADQLRAGLEAQCGGGAVPAPGEESGVPVPGGAGGGPPTTTRVNTPAAPKPTDRPVIGNVPAPGVSAIPDGNDPPGWLLPAARAGRAADGAADRRRGPRVRLRPRAPHPAAAAHRSPMRAAAPPTRSPTRATSSLRPLTPDTICCV